ICGKACYTPSHKLTREQPSCGRCGSSPRMRAVVHVLSIELFGVSLILPEFPQRPDISGIGLSDWPGLGALGEKLGYMNTTFADDSGVHVDICNVASEWESTQDFIISSEVFEHVEPPVSRAFEGAWRMLKPGGVLILEHFPLVLSTRPWYFS